MFKLRLEFMNIWYCVIVDGFEFSFWWENVRIRRHARRTGQFQCKNMERQHWTTHTEGATGKDRRQLFMSSDHLNDWCHTEMHKMQITIRCTGMGVYSHANESSTVYSFEQSSKERFIPLQPMDKINTEQNSNKHISLEEESPNEFLFLSFNRSWKFFFSAPPRFLCSLRSSQHAKARMCKYAKWWPHEMEKLKNTHVHTRT